MNHSDLKLELTHQEVEKLLLGALGELLHDDFYLLEHDLSERSIAFRLGLYLQQQIRIPYIVDCEYNLIEDGNEGRGKVLSHIDHRNSEQCPNFRSNTSRKPKVYPDVIVHVRGGKGPNLLALELKKTSNHRGCRKCDIEKLQLYIQDLNYQHAAFIEFETKEKKAEIKEIIWICSCRVTL
jgi:hypothetical protein